MNRPLPPARYYLYVLGTVNLVLLLVLGLMSMVFSSGVNVVTIAVVALVFNVAALGSVRHNA
jgi:hypothetical protein